MILKEEESKNREETLVKSYYDLKETMEKQSDKTNRMMHEMMEMMKRQVKS